MQNIKEVERSESNMMITDISYMYIHPSTPSTDFCGESTFNIQHSTLQTKSEKIDQKLTDRSEGVEEACLRLRLEFGGHGEVRREPLEVVRG